MDIASKLIDARKRKGLTQQQLADLANITVRTIQRIERGESIPRAYTLKTLRAASKMSIKVRQNTSYETND
ncbi:helix-turn-helix transcriptional regulator [Sphingobacterium oryzagri]|uniref:Helix-turn-helix transcriptional regulator n=1 Tax=Sphingobacterium oryzagri TaxID=3025669 RepID=A0ABY7WJ62_9SPHI|nr:helix-turn-helix transcriptional regulator [Sphingobacterium sp. KACC 22765]WDF69631.1 helix-turn-helix transcriptional regulator [Sphingobacterium sp. KACC 22765]